MTDHRTFSPRNGDVLLPEINTSRSTGKAIVVGAGVFGSWTALNLQERGMDTILLDMSGPGNSASASGGESRLIRATYGAARLYSQLTLQSFEEWEALDVEMEEKILFQPGVLWFSHEPNPTLLKESAKTLAAYNYPLKILPPKDVEKQYPILDLSDVKEVVLEEKGGFLHARRAVQRTVARFVDAGGIYKSLRAAPGPIYNEQMNGVKTPDGMLTADLYVFAIGAWTPYVFPSCRDLLTISRQEVFYFQYTNSLGKPVPAWVDLGRKDLFYGLTDPSYRGFKVAHDLRGPEINPSSEERTLSSTEISAARKLLSRRFPSLATAPITEGRVCQYTNSREGNFLIDLLPGARNTWIVTGGSGHGFKMGPAVGRFTYELITGQRDNLRYFEWAHHNYQ